MCICFAWGGVGGDKGEWLRGLGLGFTNPVGTGEVLDVCLCLACGGCCFYSETVGRNRATPIFRSFHRTPSSTTGGWSRGNTVMCFFIYNSEHYGLH